MDLFDKVTSLADTKTVKFLHGAIVLGLLILLCFVLIWNVSKEHNVGGGLATGSGYYGQSAGATQRHGTEFSGTNQQDRQSVLTIDAAELGMSNVNKPVYDLPREEGLVSGRGEPDFWQIGNELAAYKRAQAPHLRRAAGQEHMSGDGTVARLYRDQDDALSTLLH